jgi:hypothetical protein
MAGRFLRAITLGFALMFAVPGCAWLTSVDAVAARASTALTTMADALRVLDLLAVDYIEQLDAPTPAELDRAASIIDDLRGARYELDLALHDMQAEKYASAISHARNAFLLLQSASNSLEQAGVPVGPANSMLKSIYGELFPPADAP